MAHKHATLHTMAHEHAIIMSFRFSESCYSKYKNETARQWPGACYAQEYNSSANLGHDGKKLLPRMQMRSNQTLLLWILPFKASIIARADCAAYCWLLWYHENADKHKGEKAETSRFNYIRDVKMVILHHFELLSRRSCINYQTHLALICAGIWFGRCGCWSSGSQLSWGSWTTLAFM